MSLITIRCEHHSNKSAILFSHFCLPISPVASSTSPIIMDSSGISSVIVYALLDPEISGATPSELFARCRVSQAFNQICTTYKAQAWSAYFEKDILPYLNPSDNHRDSLLFERIQEIANEVPTPYNRPFELLNGLYLECLGSMVAESWWRSEQLKIISRNLLTQSINTPVESITRNLEELHLPQVGYEPEFQQQIELNKKRIIKICEVRRRTIVPLGTKYNVHNPDPTHGVLQPRKVKTFLEFAAWTFDVALMQDLITTFQNWFFDYTTSGSEDGAYMIDFIRVLIDLLIDVERKQGEKAHPLIHLFTEIFIIPTDRNPRGRYCATYSEEVRARLKPIINARTKEHTSLGDRYMEMKWEEDLGMQQHKAGSQRY